MTKSKRVRAVVQVVLEVESGSVWGSDTTWDQISKQAEDDVRGLLTSGNELMLKDIPRSIKSMKFIGVSIREENS